MYTHSLIFPRSNLKPKRKNPQYRILKVKERLQEGIRRKGQTILCSLFSPPLLLQKTSLSNIRTWKHFIKKPKNKQKNHALLKDQTTFYVKHYRKQILPFVNLPIIPLHVEPDFIHFLYTQKWKEKRCLP